MKKNFILGKEVYELEKNFQNTLGLSFVLLLRVEQMHC